ncbi:TonB-dependent receptor [Pseudomonas sp. 6D_7.1_Bac1]|uniref:TonB-dependent receptor n=1 Tax=Pseudomonas sp. 6D_7.1_Bac1 TaxID=2971615 RepID=UPI0021CA0F14|nr:TonB-dependent siderophore receptor [Pseudomonas sp. 6D_7.1_Bac1]MCU1751204.1 TonB-dependent siderophore receptor [Pseudomonas sp. 6D_7.1_Bac1]
MSEHGRPRRANPDSSQATQRAFSFTLNRTFSAVQMALLLGLTGGSMAVAAAPAPEPSTQSRTDTGEGGLVLSETTVEGTMGASGDLPPAYAGGQVATGSRVGLLGTKDFMETPFSAISYTDDFVRNHQAKDIGSVIGATDPSVNVPSKRAIIETFFIRGFNTSANDITYNGLIGMAPNLRGATELAERIEVLKGPSALLNGMPPDGSVAGSINMVPKRASDEPLTRLTTSFESNGLYGAHADVGRRFGEQNQFGIRYNGVYRDGDTAVDDQKQNMQLNALGLDWRAERIRLSLDAYKQREHLEGANYFGIASINPKVTQVPRAKKGDYALAPDWAYTTNDTETFLLRGEVDLNDSLTAFAAYGQRDGGRNALMTRDTLVNNAGDINVLAYRSDGQGTQKSGEAGLKGRFDTGPVGHDWSLVATQYKSQMSYKDLQIPNYVTTNYYNLDFGPTPPLGKFGAVTSRTEDKLGSVALLDTLSFLDGHIQWTLGLRNQTVESSNLTPARVRTSHYNESRVSPATALLVKVTDDVSVYANYIEGLSKGGAAPTTAANPGEVLSPIQTKQYEVGAKLDLGTFATTLAVFQIEKPSTFTDPVTNIFGVNGEQRNRGVEWNFFGEAQPDLRLMGGVSYTQAVLTKALVAANEGNQVTGVPKIIAKLGAEYDLERVPGLTLTAGTNYVGSRYVTDDHRMELPSYTVFDVGGRYTTKVMSKPVTLRANVENIANRAYWIGSYSGGDGSGLSGGLGAPRTLQLSASVDF